MHLGVSLVDVSVGLLLNTGLLLDVVLGVMNLLHDVLSIVSHLVKSLMFSKEFLDVLLEVRNHVEVSFEVTNWLAQEAEVSKGLDWGGGGLLDNSSLLGLERLS